MLVELLNCFIINIKLFLYADQQLPKHLVRNQKL